MLRQVLLSSLFRVSTLNRSFSLSIPKHLDSTSSCFTADTTKTNINNLLRGLPKMSTKQAMRKSKKQALKDFVKYPPASIYLRVVGSGAYGAPRSLYVFMGQTSYLFNCGEGTQRLCHESRVKLSGVENVFITHKSWKNVGGLPGMLLTLQDEGSEQILLHGPPGIHILYKDTKKMLLFKKIKIACNHYTTNDGEFGHKDAPLIVQAVPIHCRSQEEEEPGTPPTLDTATQWQKSPPHSRSSSPELDPQNNSSASTDDSNSGRGSKRSSDSSSSDSDLSETTKRRRIDEMCTRMAMAYVCRVAPKVGPLLVEKCVKAGVTQGPLLGKLKNGHDVTLPSGVVVKATDVKGPDDPSLVFYVVEAPTEEHLESLVSEPRLAPPPASSATGDGEADVNNTTIPAIIVHFTPSHIVQHALYQQWMEGFPASTSHMFINNDNSCTGSEAIHRMQHKMGYLDPRSFPALVDNSIPDAASENEISIPDSDDRYAKAVTSLVYHFRPHLKFDRAMCPRVDRVAIENEITESGCPRGIAVQDLSATQPEYPIITFLGTGSAIPCKTRNVSGILAQVSAGAYMFLDCGEGSHGQLVRLLGAARADEVSGQLTAIYVSHHHADHHIGLISLLQARARALLATGRQVSPLPVLGPTSICEYLSSYHHHFEPIAHLYKFYNNSMFRDGSTKDEYNSLYESMQVSSIETCEVNHCLEAFGVSVVTKSGKKLVYSGDTRPSSSLVHIGLDCDILIHEATMADDLAWDAKIKKHCTVSEALTVATNMKAKNIILTHFSQRYSKLALLPEHHEHSDFSNVALAYDFMTVRESDIPRIAKLYPHLLKMFSAARQEMEEKSIKRQNDRMRDERIKEDLMNFKRYREV